MSRKATKWTARRGGLDDTYNVQKKMGHGIESDRCQNIDKGRQEQTANMPTNMESVGVVR